MAKKKSRFLNEHKNQQRNDSVGFFKELVRESDRGCVLLAGAFLDVQLETLLQEFFNYDVPSTSSEAISDHVSWLLDPKRRGPLSDFKTRIVMTHCLGLISNSVQNDLDTIREIRNIFAHQLHGISFDTPVIAEEVQKLKWGSIVVSPLSPIEHQTRWIFMFTATIHSEKIGFMREAIQRNLVLKPQLKKPYNEMLPYEVRDEPSAYSVSGEIAMLLEELRKQVRES